MRIVGEFHQTAVLGRGRHSEPGPTVCVMELASMLAGERFSDRPVSVCPQIGALLRVYNDRIDDRRRQDLYRYASDSVGTRAGPRLQGERTARVLDFGDHWWSQRRQRKPLRHRLRLAPWRPSLYDGPERIAEYAIAAIGRPCSVRHAALIELLDELIEMGQRADRLETLPQLVARDRTGHRWSRHGCVPLTVCAV